MERDALAFPEHFPDWHDWEELCDLELGYARNPQWVRDEIQLCALNRINDPTCGFRYWLPRYWKIVDKDRRKRRLIPNALQRDYMDRHESENIILKYRKGGASTIVGALYFWDCLFHHNVQAVIAAHTLKSADYLFGKLHLGLDELPRWMKPPTKYGSRRELVFGHNRASMIVETAGGEGLGRGGDADRIHLSEFAWYKNPWRVLSGLLESGRFGMWLDIESTPNGWNEFRALYQEAKEGGHRRVFFFPWYAAEDNREALDPGETLDLGPEELGLGLTAEQAKWRRGKQRDLRELFLQEHPEDDESCFLASGSLKFPGSILRELRQVVQQYVEPVPLRGVGPWGGDDNGCLVVWDLPRPEGRYLIGADVAEGNPKGNFSAAGVLYAGPDGPEQVAAWVGRLNPNDFAFRLAALGRWYGTPEDPAEIAVERNNHGHSTLRTLAVEARYPRARIYRHHQYNQRKNLAEAKMGWPTDALTRPQMLDDLVDAIVTGGVKWRHDRFLAECMGFEIGDEFRGKSEDFPVADQPGSRFNDTVFAWGIALQVYRRGKRYRE